MFRVRFDTLGRRGPWAALAPAVLAHLLIDMICEGNGNAVCCVPALPNSVLFLATRGRHSGSSTRSTGPDARSGLPRAVVNDAQMEMVSPLDSCREYRPASERVSFHYKTFSFIRLG